MYTCASCRSIVPLHQKMLVNVATRPVKYITHQGVTKAGRNILKESEGHETVVEAAVCEGCHVPEPILVVGTDTKVVVSSAP